jgi:uncharacterized membrane protein
VTVKSRSARFDMEILVGYILQFGVLLSVILLAIGVVGHWITTGSLEFAYSISGMNFFGFVLSDLQQVFAGTLRPRLFSNLGIAALMLTPYIRVLASMVYFAVAERNLKYTLFTGFVYVVLTYSLFMR